MPSFSRREWLRKAGMAGTLALVGGNQIIARTARDVAGSPQPALWPTPGAPIRLSSNENPYGPSPKVREAISSAFDMACRYPYAYSEELRKMLAEKEGVSPDHIMLTAGSTEGLRLAGMIYGSDGREVIAADPTFQTLMRYAKKFGAHIHRIPVTDDLKHDLPAMARKINASTGMVYVCNPNNPTGAIVDGSELQDFCASAARRTLVFVDEAYIDYIEEPGYPSMVSLVKQDADLVVARTFSKVYGLAGMRIGYLIARPDIIEKLADRMVAFTNTPALIAAQAALTDKEFHSFSLKKNRSCKKMIYETLDGLGLNYVRSHTNFVFFESGREISSLQNDMIAQGVKIGRPFPPLTQWCRISTGKTEEVEAFCRGLKSVMG